MNVINFLKYVDSMQERLPVRYQVKVIWSYAYYIIERKIPFPKSSRRVSKNNLFSRFLRLKLCITACAAFMLYRLYCGNKTRETRYGLWNSGKIFWKGYFTIYRMVICRQLITNHLPSPILMMNTSANYFVHKKQNDFVL